MYDPADISPPPSPNWQKATRWLAQLAKETGMDLCDEAQVRKVIAMYYGMISHVDREFVRLIEYLEARGLLERTWIFYLSDHGDFTGEHGMMNKAEMFFDCLLHLPLVVRAPEGALPAGRVCDEFIESVDIAPTICEIAGLDRPDHMRGRSFLPWASGEREQPFREAVFAAMGRNCGHFPHNLPQGIVRSAQLVDVATMVRTATGKLVHNPEHENELYLLDEDPWELENRHGEPEAAVAQSDLEERLAHWLKECPIPPPPGEA
jgi:arylsulfatase A-like enzyme